MGKITKKKIKKLKSKRARIVYCYGINECVFHQSNDLLARIGKVYLPKAVSCLLPKEGKKNSMVIFYCLLAIGILIVLSTICRATATSGRALRALRRMLGDGNSTLATLLSTATPTIRRTAFPCVVLRTGLALFFFFMENFSERQLLDDLFQAYFDARKNKRNTINALSFEIDFEKKLFELFKEIKERRYKISSSICFVCFQPVKREVFASDFRDRIIHHLVYNYINPLFERQFINDNYSCRVGKGTAYGIKRLDHFIRSCSKNYTQDCYILKLDIKGYFMSIDRLLLYQKVKAILFRYKDIINFDLDLVLYLLEKIIFNDPTKNCIIKGKKDDWVNLPKDKSLFFTEKGKGLPIGNLTSQLFGNVYLNDFDHFVKCKLGCKYYGRYVDDIVILHQDKEYLKSVIPQIKEYLKSNLSLEIHPNKIYLQHYSKGVNFLGATIKPYRIYIGNRTKGNFYQKIKFWNGFWKKGDKVKRGDFEKFISSVNSYLGMVEHYQTYKLRKKIIEQNLPHFIKPYINIANGFTKISFKPEIKYKKFISI
ncbi:MAG TPA: RNA-directed DNA polymerase [Candidatus Paceibacterota bacterium]|nr:RNA-directed DNA polymerase [Candidatus Paceibacterota bacterium]